MLSDSLLQYLHSAEKKYMLGVQIERSQTEFREVNLPSGLCFNSAPIPFLGSRTHRAFVSWSSLARTRSLHGSLWSM